MFSLEGFSQLSCTLVCTLICGKYYMCWLLWRWRRRNHLRYYTCSMGECKMNVFVPKDSAGELHTKAACIPVVEMMEMEPSELPHAKINPSSWGAKHTEFTGNRQKKLYNFTCLWLKRVCIYMWMTCRFWTKKNVQFQMPVAEKSMHVWMTWRFWTSSK